MDWSFLKFKKTVPAAGNGSPAPFFNVMPKAVVQEPVPEPVAHPVAAALTAQARPSFAPAASAWGPAKQPSAPTIASLLTPTPPTVASASVAAAARSASGAGGSVPTLPPRGWQLLGGACALLFAFAAIWYAYSTFGGGGRIFDGIEKLWKRVPPIVEKKPNTSEAAPTGTKDITAGDMRTEGEWRVQYFGSVECAECADSADPDADGATNVEEFTAKTNPKKADTDGDGLADGDELKIFLCDPTNTYTAKNTSYTDADYIKGGWDCVYNPAGDTRLSDTRKQQIAARITQYGLHEPSIATLGTAVGQFGAPVPSSAPSEATAAGDATAADTKLEHDTERVMTIKQVGAALLAYKQALGNYPQVSSFAEMAQKIKPFLGDAVSTVDPVNVRPMTYEYQLNQNGNSFLLTYYSETQQQIARYTESKALAEGGAEVAKERDAQRTKDLDKIRAALLIYSTATASPHEGFVFPVPSQIEAKLAPQYIAVLPRDPLTKQSYSYEVGDDGATFTLKAVYERPAAGKTGYLCNQEECRGY